MLSEERLNRITRAVARKQWDMTVVLENVHDPHNLGAVLRSCESVGISEIYVLYTEETPNAARYVGRNSSSGVAKWIKSHFYYNLDECFDAVRSKYTRILATHMHEEAVDLYEMDLTSPFALLFGNEKFGLTNEALHKADGNFIIPIQGMAESLNVSVACSVSVYEAMRQRMAKGFYTRDFDKTDVRMGETYQEFLAQARPRIYEKDAALLTSKLDEIMSKKKG